MPFIPRPVKPPARVALTCKVPVDVAALLKAYAEFLDSTQEYVLTETLRLAFRRDKDFQAWLATVHPDAAPAEGDASSHDASDPKAPASTMRPVGREGTERSAS
jgi:hypothetical protein